MTLLPGRILHVFEFTKRFSLLRRFAITSLVTFVLIGLGLGYLIGQAVENSALAEARIATYHDLRGKLGAQLRHADLAGRISSSRRATLSGLVHHGILSDRVVRVKIWNRLGVVVYSSDSAISGARFPIDDGLQAALRGKLASDVSNLSAARTGTTVDSGSCFRFMRLYPFMAVPR
jgi:hypothetical protein